MARGFSQRVRRQRVEWRWTCAYGRLSSRREAGSPRGARKEFLEKKIHRVLLFFRGIFPAGFASSSQGDSSRERALRS